MISMTSAQLVSGMAVDQSGDTPVIVALTAFALNVMVTAHYIVTATL